MRFLCVYIGKQICLLKYRCFQIDFAVYFTYTGYEIYTYNIVNSKSRTYVYLRFKWILSNESAGSNVSRYVRESHNVYSDGDFFFDQSIFIPCTVSYSFICNSFFIYLCSKNKTVYCYFHHLVEIRESWNVHTYCIAVGYTSRLYIHV